MGQDQVSGGVSVLYWLAAPVAMLYGNLPQFGNKDRKEEIRPSPMTKVPIPTEMSKGQSDNTNNATKKFD